MKISKAVSRVVLDTNLVLSVLVFQSSCHTLTKFKRGRIYPLISRETAAELIRALTYLRFRLTANEQEELLADYLPYCLATVIPNPPSVTPPCRDQADIPFLQLTLAGKADVLFTVDKDFLLLAEAFNCRIVTADTFLTEFAGC